MVMYLMNIAIQPLKTYLSEIQVINCSVITPVSNHSGVIFFASASMNGYFPTDHDTTPKSVNTFVSYVIASFTWSEENPVIQQHSCDNELCRNTKNDRYLDPARSSPVKFVHRRIFFLLLCHVS